MKIVKIEINNYRILKKLSLDVEKDLSLVIGKNNCGKTSLLSILNKFIGVANSNTFNYDDFNIEFKALLFNAVESDKNLFGKECSKGLELYLYISYDEEDNLSNIRPLMLDLDPDNNIVILKFEYILDEDTFTSLKEDFKIYYTRFESNPKYEIAKKDCFENFMKSKHRKYFQINKKTVLFDKDTKIANDCEYRVLNSAIIDINKIISFKYISARRDTINKDNDGSLSSLSGRYYERTKTEEENPAIQKFEDALVETDFSLTDVYHGLFENVIMKVKKFGGIKENEMIVKIISTLSQQELLKGNTTVVYQAEDHQLPESYNGLGYLNLISMIIEIETLLSEFRNDRDNTRRPADINILFIEEPEAHTHPQMQYVFIKNIKELLKEGTAGENNKKQIDLQTIITTHSSHIISECDFDDIKYFQRTTETSVISKNLKELEIKYKDEKNLKNNHFKFLKQYLTLNYSEIFFADKVVLYEGETERILLPAMMKKIDEEEHDDKEAPLLSQNISLIECGAYAQIFDCFLSFINVKTLIITDIDSGKKEIRTDRNGIDRTVSTACSVEKGNLTTNSALKHYYESILQSKKEEEQLAVFTSMPVEEKILSNEDGKWVVNIDGKLMLVFQTNEDDTYYPRSFEDAFIQINRKFIVEKLSQFRSLQNSNKVSELNVDNTYRYNAFEIAEDCIKSKASFAMDILLNSEIKDKKTYSNWKTPKYIKEGLVWLRKN